MYVNGLKEAFPMGLSLEMNAIDMMMNAYSQQELFGCSVNAEHHNQ